MTFSAVSAQLYRCFFYIVLLLCGAKLNSAPLDSPAIQSCLWTHSAQMLPLLPCQQDVTPQDYQQRFGSPHSAFPLRYQKYLLNNNSSQSIELQLWLGVPDLYQLELKLLHKGSVLKTSAYGPADSFAQREVLNNKLVFDIRLAPGETELWLAYYIHARGSLSPQLYQKDALQAADTGQYLLNGVVVGMMLTLLIVMFFYQSFAGQNAYFAYSLVVLGQVLLLLQMEGYLFRFIWPDNPALNHQMPGLISAVALAAHSVFVMLFFQLKARFALLFRLHLLLLIALGISLCFSGTLWLLPAVVLVAIGYALLSVCTAVLVFKARLPGAVLYLVGTVLLMLFSVLLLILGVVGLNPFPEFSFFNYPKLGFLMETSCLSAAMVSKVRAFQQQQAELRVRRLAEAQQLLLAEQDKKQAQEQVLQQSLQLASTSHDISQPLSSLRYAIEVLKQSQELQPVAEHIDKTISYAQTLLKDVIEQSKRDHQQPQAVVLSKLMLQLQADFQGTALHKGLQLKVIPCSLQVSGSYLVLYRILANLLSNALRYSQKGKVLLGVRRRDDGLIIQVLDTGPGLLPGQLKLLTQAFTRDAQDQAGYGLGLFIVKSLCEQSGYQLKVSSRLNKGSCFSIRIPTASATSNLM